MRRWSLCGGREWWLGIGLGSEGMGGLEKRKREKKKLTWRARGREGVRQNPHPENRRVRHAGK